MINVVDDKDDVSDRVDDDNPSTVTAIKDTSTDTEIKDQWVFPGYISFVLLGPIMQENMDRCYQVCAFLASDGNEKSTGIILKMKRKVPASQPFQCMQRGS